MPQIIPIKALKNTAEISQRCHATNEPIFVTKNGYGDMVVMSMQSYEEQMARYQLYATLDAAERQAEAGDVTDARQTLREVRERHGL